MASGAFTVTLEPAGLRLGGRVGVFLAVAAMLAGCAHIGPNTVVADRFDYSAAIADSWKVSIVDLLKLLGLDSSLSARKQLANLD
jgi:hypothetical protein